MRRAVREEEERPTADNLAAVLGMSGTFVRFGERLEIAEEEIAAAISRHPEKKAVLDACFGALCPPPAISGFIPAVYRSHVRELLERAVRGEDLRLATDAEIMACFYQCALAAPLNGIGSLCYEVTFERVFRGNAKAEALVATKVGREGWKGELEESLAAARVRLAKSDRVVGARSLKA